MTPARNRPVRVHIAPQHHPWREEVAAAARRADAEVVDAGDAAAVV